MTTVPLSHADVVFDVETYAQDMRDYWSWAASQPDPVQYLAELAEERDLDRIEDAGIARFERGL